MCILRGMEAFRSISLTDTPARVVIYAVLAVATLLALAGLLRGPARRRTLWCLAGSAAAAVAVFVVLEVVWRPFPDHVPVVVYAAGAAAVFVALCALLQPAPKGLRVALVLMIVPALIAAGGVANLVYRQFPTVDSLNPTPVTVAMNMDEFAAAREAPRIGDREVGALVTMPMKGRESGFDARDAVAYVPPAYWSKPDVRLPVLVLMVGNPGKPEQWFTAGGAARTADRYQAAHGGEAPIIVSVDPTGSFTGNPGCVDGPELKIDTYLSRDVPDLIRQRFRVNPDQSAWTIGGLSYGGTCSLQIVANHPEAYGAFLDFSGQAEPTLGSREQTVRELFGGDEAAFRAVNPADLLTAAASGDNPRDYSRIEGRFVSGEKDAEALDALRHLNDLAGKAGMKTTLTTVPGGHSYEVWRSALEETIGWAAQRGGLHNG